MNVAAPIERDLIFISKATPGDDQFVLWLAPRLEAAGYKVFADIFDLDAGDEWRGKLTSALQTRAIKMLLCCSDDPAGTSIRASTHVHPDQASPSASSAVP